MVEAGRGAVSAAFLGVAPTSVPLRVEWGVGGCEDVCIGQISREAPRLTQASPVVLKVEVVRSLSHRNVLCVAA